MEKDFIRIKIENLIEWKEPNGEGCLVSDKITKDGWKVGFMYREEPDADRPDSGWRFLKGDESDEYINEPGNCHVFALNTVCNYDPDIIPCLHAAIDSAFIRVDGHHFEMDDGTKPIYFEKQDRK